jgi:hypothetical protein
MHRDAKVQILLQPFLSWLLLLSQTLVWAMRSPAGNTAFTNAIVLSVADQVESRNFGSHVWHPA